MFYGKWNDNFMFYFVIISFGFDVKINWLLFMEIKYLIFVLQIIKVFFLDLFILE